MHRPERERRILSVLPAEIWLGRDKRLLTAVGMTIFRHADS